MGLDSSKRNLLYLQLSINIQLYSSCCNGYLSIQNVFRFPQVLWCYIFKSRPEEKKILYTASLPSTWSQLQKPHHWPLSRQHCEFTKTLLVPKRSKLVIQSKPWSVSGTGGVMLTAPTSSDLFEIPPVGEEKLKTSLT